MATRTIWQDIYGIELDLGTTLTAHLAANPGMATASNIGFQGIGSGTTGKFGMPLNDHPNFKSPSGTIDQEQARGISERQVNEYNTVQTGEAVEFSLPMLGDAYNIAAMATLFFQDGAIESTSGNATSGGNQLICNPYTSADTDNFGYFCRIMQGATEADDVDLLVKGGICSTLALSSEAGGLLTVEATVGASSWVQQDLGTGGTPSLTGNLNNSFVTQTPLKHQDMNCLLYDSFTTYSAISIGPVVTISFTTSTNVFADSGNALYSSGFRPGDTVKVTGSASNNGTYTILTLKADGSEGAFDSKATIATEAASASITIVKIAEWIDLQVPSWSLSMNNNATFNYYNDDQISGIHLGRLVAEGSFTMPWGQDVIGKNYVIDRFLAGNACRIAFAWGQDGAVVAKDSTLETATCTWNEIFDLGTTAVATIGLDRYKTDAGATTPNCFISVVANARITDYEVAGDNELSVECTFQAVKDLDPTDVPNGESEYNSVDLYCCYDDTKLESGAA